MGEAPVPCSGTSTEFSASAGFALEPGYSHPVQVNFAPVAAGTESGCLQLQVVNQAGVPQPPITISVTGVGADPSTLLDVNITGVQVAASAQMRKPLTLSVSTANVGGLSGDIAIEVVAAQNGVEVYRTATTVYSAAGTKVVYPGFGFTPTKKGTVTWTVTLTDGYADQDIASADTVVR